MVAFFPWLEIRQRFDADGIRLLPYRPGSKLPAQTSSPDASSAIKRILLQYRDLNGQRLSGLTLIQVEEDPLDRDLPEPVRAQLFGLRRHLAVSGLSGRVFDGSYLDKYTADGHYQLLIQAFELPYRGGVMVSHRRKEGSHAVFMGQSQIRFTRPAHLVSQGEPKIDLGLLSALRRTRELGKDCADELEASITQFLLSNTDAPDVSVEVEIIAAYAAFERLTKSNSNIKQVKDRVMALLALADQSNPTQLGMVNLRSSAQSAEVMLRSWLQKFYELRGHVAHGKNPSSINGKWTQNEHLLAAAVVYPLLLKCKLASQSLYALTDEDVAWIFGLDQLIGETPFFATADEAPTLTRPPTASRPWTAREVVHYGNASAPNWQKGIGAIYGAVYSIQLKDAISQAMEIKSWPKQ